jgi:hypothetical protein
MSASLGILLLQTSKTDNNALDIDAIYNLKQLRYYNCFVFIFFSTAFSFFFLLNIFVTHYIPNTNILNCLLATFTTNKTHSTSNQQP